MIPLVVSKHATQVVLSGESAGALRPDLALKTMALCDCKPFRRRVYSANAASPYARHSLLISEDIM
jgi:hypothetical protein